MSDEQNTGVTPKLQEDEKYFDPTLPMTPDRLARELLEAAEDEKWRDPAYRAEMLDSPSARWNDAQEEYADVAGDPTLADRLNYENPIDILDDVRRDVLINAGIPAVDKTDPARRSLLQPSLWQELRTWELRQQAAQPVPAIAVAPGRSQSPGQVADRLAAVMTREIGRDDVNLTLPTERDPGRVLGR